MSPPNDDVAISKSVWLNATQCPALGWYDLHLPSSPPGENERFRMEEGQRVGTLAQALFPEGVWASKDSKAIADPKEKTLFETRFDASPFVARADIITREGKGWHVLEVKSSFSDTSNLAKHTHDLAYTVMVARRAGLKVEKATLVLLSRKYRHGDSTDLLFDLLDVTKDVAELVNTFEKMADSLAKAVLAANPPRPRMIPLCGDCSYFASHCMGVGIERTILEIPRLHKSKLQQLAADGIVSLYDVPETLLLSEKQERVKSAALCGKMFVDRTLPATLKSIEWPCHYLDFETVATVLPLYPGQFCHQQVLTQFSVHRRERIGGDVVHNEFLADASRDCQRELAEALIHALGGRGAVVVYGSFERTRINGLSVLFPDLEKPLQAIVGRLVDLLSIVSNGIYHPEFRGSFSIKKVLPALVPELSYTDLDIGEGSTAIARFARMASGELSAKDVETTRKQLLEYCKMDTHAMVCLHERLVEISVDLIES